MGLWDSLTTGARAGHGTLHCWVGDRFESTPWSQVTAEAEAMTRGMRGAGVGPGQVAATVLTNTPFAVRGILATWLAGGTLASLPVPARGMDADEYVAQLRGLCEQIEPTALLLDEWMLGLIPEELRERFNANTWESFSESGLLAPEPPGEEETAFVQYSSGSTTAPKGCALTTRAISAQLEIVMTMLEAIPGEETAISWLPLSHDMGIFGNLLTPWAYDEDLVLSTPERFMTSPRSWFADAAAFGATVACGTNGALGVAARVQRGALKERLRLHSLIIGAERVQGTTLAAALEAFGPSGLRPESLMPAYGLAEATLAVTATPRSEAPRVLTIDGAAIAEGEVRLVEPQEGAATQIVSAGVPCAGVTLNGQGPGRLNELVVDSPSLASGYFRDPEQTAERFGTDGVLTRDLAFVSDGWLFPVGRSDDLISIAGRKVYACEIEAGVDTLEGVRRGCSTLIESFDDGRQSLTLLAELSDETDDGGVEALARDVASLAQERAAVMLDHCVFLGKGTLPKTPSGKIQRYRCRELLERDAFRPIATIALGGKAANRG